MYRTGHIGAALVCIALPSLLATTLFHPLYGIVMTAAAVSSSMIPDIDQRLPLEHRGITHTVWAVIAITVLYGFGGHLAFTGLSVSLAGVSSLIGQSLVALPQLATPEVGTGAVAVGAFVGVGSHLLADSITVGSGAFAITPLAPLSDRPLRFGLTKSDSRLYNLGLCAVGLSIHLAILYYLY